MACATRDAPGIRKRIPAQGGLFMVCVPRKSPLLGEPFCLCRAMDPYKGGFGSCYAPIHESPFSCKRSFYFSASKMLKILLDSRKNLCYNIRNTVEVHCVKSTADAKGLTARCQQERGKCRRKIGVTSVLVWMNKIIPTVAFAESYLNSTGISVCLQSRPVCRLFCFSRKCKNAPDFGKNILCSGKREQHEKNNF